MTTRTRQASSTNSEAATTSSDFHTNPYFGLKLAEVSNSRVRKAYERRRSAHR